MNAVDNILSAKKMIQEYYANREDVVMVYLFGSVVSANFSEQSDIDVAVFYRSGCVPDFFQRLQEQADLSERLRREVDLSPLNQVSPILGYQVLKHGECVVNRDPHTTNEFFIRTINEYFDLKQSRLVIERSLQNSRVL